MSVKKTEASFLGSDGVHQIFYTVYEPENPKAVYQIAHGMAEHFGRYEDFCLFLADNGFVVCGDDHIGHGRTGKAVGELGYYGEVNDAPGAARNHMIDDMHLLTGLMKEKYPGLPYVLMGHSMGSMLARMYLALHGSELDAAVIMGTCGTGGSSKIAGVAGAMCGLIGSVKGKKYVSPMITNMAFGTYNDHFKEENDPISWVSKNEENRARYKADELAGFPFSVSAFRSMMELVQYITSPGAFAAVPDDLPILLIAGAEDPVGNYGAGVDEVYQAFRKAGKTNVTMKLYEGDRHEILNEDDRKDVYDYILNWVSPYALKK